MEGQGKAQQEKEEEHDGAIQRPADLAQHHHVDADALEPAGRLITVKYQAGGILFYLFFFPPHEEFVHLWRYRRNAIQELRMAMAPACQYHEPDALSMSGMTNRSEQTAEDQSAWLEKSFK